MSCVHEMRIVLLFFMSYVGMCFSDKRNSLCEVASSLSRRPNGIMMHPDVLKKTFFTQNSSAITVQVFTSFQTQHKYGRRF